MQNKPISFSARHKARSTAVQALYQWLLSENPIQEIEIEFLTHKTANKIDKAYFSELLHGVPRHLSSLDEAIQTFSAIPVDDLDPVELSILRLATYELLYIKEVPYKVVINEALELCKTFGSVEGYKFVNGVLDKIANKIQGGTASDEGR